MAFFQALLIVGYGWAHWAQRRFGVRHYGHWHFLLLLTPLLFIRADCVPTARQDAPLFLEVIRLLTISAGAPFLALSTTSLILQRWLAGSALPQRSNPYVLYAASNAGSILALLSYPALVEPLAPLGVQWKMWWAMYAALIALHLFCLPGGLKKRSPSGEHVREIRAHAPARHYAVWLTLSAAGCAMSLAVTNAITFDVVSLPLFWTLPLTVYLLTFVLLFKRNPWNPAWLQRSFDWAVLGAALIYLLMQLRMTFPLALQLLMQLALLFVICMRVHGWLAESRPRDGRLLTSYFVTMSVGGFLGSLIVSWIVPLAFSTLAEVPLALMLAAGGAMLYRTWIPASGDGADKPKSCAIAKTAGWGMLMAAGLTLAPLTGRLAHLPIEAIAGLCALPLATAIRAAAGRPGRLLVCLTIFALAIPWTGQLAEGEHGVVRLRNYYGLYKIFDQEGIRYLQHGSTEHGRQFLDPVEAATPLAYYHPSTPLPSLMIADPLHAKEIAMIGLGAGAVAAYLEPGQHLTVYELDRDNLPVAEDYFSYLRIGRDRGGKIDFVFGDGRIKLREAPDGAYDMLIIDAFSSGAIPAHLLTVEAMGEYFRTLKPGGVLLFHTSNKYVDLEPLIASLARESGLAAAAGTNLGKVDPLADLTFWTALSREPETLEPLIGGLGWRRLPNAPGQNLPRPWTDHYSNLVGLILR